MPCSKDNVIQSSNKSLPLYYNSAAHAWYVAAVALSSVLNDFRWKYAMKNENDQGKVTRMDTERRLDIFCVIENVTLPVGNL